MRVLEHSWQNVNFDDAKEAASAMTAVVKKKQTTVTAWSV